LDAVLDVKIDRLIKRLLHLKAVKQMIRAASKPFQSATETDILAGDATTAGKANKSIH
jgi:hypothetical protein